MRSAARRRAIWPSRKILLRTTALCGALPLALAVLSGPAMAQQIWQGPGTDWNTGANWSTGTVPTAGNGDTAIFQNNGAPSALSTSTGGSASAIQFDASAPSYTLTANNTFSLTGSGVINNSGNVQNFIIANGQFWGFYNAASAGANTTYTVQGSGGIGFEGTGSGASASFILGTNGTIYLDTSGTKSLGSLTGGGSSRVIAFDNATVSVGALGQDETFAGRFEQQGVVLSVTKTGTGTLTLTDTSGASNYTGTTTVAQGTLNVQAATALGSAVGGTTVSSGATLALQGGVTFASEALTVSGTGVGGAGALRSVSGDNVWGGSILLGAGTRISADANTLTLSGGITGAAQDLSLSGAGNIIVNGVIATGAGALFKGGAGTVTLAAVNSYTGATTVTGGTLSVNGSIATSSLTTVSAGATLSGTGTVGNTAINDATLAPGNSIGTLTVQGNLSLTAASTYMLEVSPASSDRVNVTGTATLGGATVNAQFAAGSYVNKQYTIVNATGGVSGTFGTQVNTNLPTNFSSSLTYDTNNAYLNLTLNFTPSPGPTAPSYAPLNANQANVGNALTGFFNSTGGIPLVFGALNAQGLSQVSGEVGTGSQQTTFNAMTMFMGVMTDPFAAGRGAAAGAMPYADEAMAYARERRPTDAFAAMPRKALPMTPVPVEKWNVWAAGFGGSQTTDGSVATGSNDTRSSVYGVAVGADYWFSPVTVAGLSMAGGATNFSVNGGGSGRSDLFQVGGCVRHTVGSTYLMAAAAYGWQDITTDRIVTVAGIDQLRANFKANSYSGRIEIGNRFVAPWVGGIGITPYGAVQVTAFALPSYAESAVAGANTFALAYSGTTVTATRSEIGLRTDKSYAVNDAVLTLRGRAAWAHDFNPDRAATATFQTLPGATFVVNGAALARDAALTSATAEMKWMNGWSLAGTFEGEFSNVTRSYAGKGTVRYAW